MLSRVDDILILFLAAIAHICRHSLSPYRGVIPVRALFCHLLREMIKPPSGNP